MARKEKRKRPVKSSVAGENEARLSKEDAAGSITLFQQRCLQFLVFTSGAVLMALEIAGSRVLAPYFGNSVFVWGSLISVFLIALSLGYYLGGRIADEFPSLLLLNSICVVVALLIFAIGFLSEFALEWITESGFGERSGPLVAATLLFLLPSVGMGVVSPFAVRLATHSVNSVGRSAGTLYALSTLGSIAGTLLTTFVLIPVLGLGTIVKILAAVMLVVAVVTMPFRGAKEALFGIATACVVAVLIFASKLEPMPPTEIGDRIVLDVDSAYHNITVIDNGDMRKLCFDRFVETAIQTEKPYPSLASYTDYFHLGFLAQPTIKRALFIGAGGGVGPRTFLEHNPDMMIDVVDIDAKVLEIAQSHFFLQQSEHIRPIAEDGRMFVRNSKDVYDCVVLDSFTIGGRIPFHLVTKEFLTLCRERLSSQGVFIMNINSAIDGSLANIFQSMYTTIQAVFPQTYVFAKDLSLYRRDLSRNVIFVATKDQQRISPETWSARAESYDSDSYVDQDRMELLVADLVDDVHESDSAPVFTDDYAPIEMMPF